MGARLNPRQAAVLEFIRATIRHRGIGPSDRRIRDAGLGMTERTQVNRVIAELIRMGIVCRGGPPLPNTNQPSLVVIEAVSHDVGAPQDFRPTPHHADANRRAQIGSIS